VPFALAATIGDAAHSAEVIDNFVRGIVYGY